MVAEAPEAKNIVKGEGVELCSVFEGCRGDTGKHRGKIVNAVVKFVKEAVH